MRLKKAHIIFCISGQNLLHFRKSQSILSRKKLKLFLSGVVRPQKNSGGVKEWPGRKRGAFLLILVILLQLFVGAVPVLGHKIRQVIKSPAKGYGLGFKFINFP